MEPSTNKEQDPPHGGSWTRQEDGSLTLVETTQSAVEVGATEPKPAADSGIQE